MHSFWMLWSISGAMEAYGVAAAGGGVGAVDGFAGERALEDEVVGLLVRIAEGEDGDELLAVEFAIKQKSAAGRSEYDGALATGEHGFGRGITGAGNGAHRSRIVEGICHDGAGYQRENCQGKKAHVAIRYRMFAALTPGAEVGFKKKCVAWRLFPCPVGTTLGINSLTMAV